MRDERGSCASTQVFLNSPFRELREDLLSIDANPAAACFEFEWRVWPVTYFIAAKFIVHTAGAGPCIQAKCRVIRQSEVNPAAASLELVAAERVQRPVKGNRTAAGFQRRFPA